MSLSNQPWTRKRPYQRWASRMPSYARLRQSNSRRFPYKKNRRSWTKKKSTISQALPAQAVRNQREAWGLPRCRLGNIAPARMLVNMPYYEQGTVAAVGAAYADFTFSLTSIYDPSVTATGHQARGHDQWATLYTYYRVRKVIYPLLCNFHQPTHITRLSSTCKHGRGTMIPLLVLFKLLVPVFPSIQLVLLLLWI